MNNTVKTGLMYLGCAVNKVPGVKFGYRIRYSDQHNNNTERWIIPLRPERASKRCRFCYHTHKLALKFVSFCLAKQAERQFFVSQMQIVGWCFGSKGLASYKPGANL